MRQLLSSLFDALTAVALLVGAPAAALHPTPVTVGVAGAAAALIAGRVTIERAKLRTS